MKKPLKYLANIAVRPFVKRYLSKTRMYRGNGLTLAVPPQVFHPGFYFSTQFLLRYIMQLDMAGKTFLEPGAGSGLISFSAARKGAIVTATDINPIAVEYLQKNSASNHLAIHILQSDLFDNISQQQFDFIAINPPYYKKHPHTMTEYAWYCGENGEYFTKLFKGLGHYMHPQSMVLMVLCDECDLHMIESIASKFSFSLALARSERKFSEMNYIFRISRV